MADVLGNLGSGSAALPGCNSRTESPPLGAPAPPGMDSSSDGTPIDGKADASAQGDGVSGAEGTDARTDDASDSAMPPGPFSITNQQPASLVPYSQNPYSVTPKPLPANVMSHLAPNGDAIAQCAFNDCGTLNGAAQYVNWATPGTDDFGVPFYYGEAADPFYKKRVPPARDA